jgi:hypothetical protein
MEASEWLFAGAEEAARDEVVIVIRQRVIV